MSMFARAHKAPPQLLQRARACAQHGLQDICPWHKWLVNDTTQLLARRMLKAFGTSGNLCHISN